MTATPADLRQQAQALLDEADRLEALVPRDRAELAELRRIDPELVVRFHESGDLDHLLSTTPTTSTAGDPRSGVDHLTPAERALIERNPA
jgi:hypothetical protein